MGKKSSSSSSAPTTGASTKGRKKPGSTEVATAVAKRPHRFHPGTVSLREIKRYQKSTANLLQKLPFQRFIRETSSNHAPDMRFQVDALAAIQEASESLLESVLRDANAVAIHSKRKTVEAQDVKLVVDLRKQANW